MVRYLYNEGAFSHYQRLYYLYDTLGSVAQVTAESGLAVQENLYTPYGEAYNTAADSVNRLRFVGRYGGYTDDDTKLTYFWHRWYDSSDGRWVSRDPIGVVGGVNLYNYVGNRVVNESDINGLVMVPSANPWPTATPNISPEVALNNNKNPIPVVLPPAPVCETKPSCYEIFEKCCYSAYGTFIIWTAGKVVFDVACANVCRVRCLGRPTCTSMCVAACFLVGEQIPSLDSYFKKLDKCAQDFTACSKNK